MRLGKRIMPYAFSLLFALPGLVLYTLAFGEVDVAAGNEVLVELRRLAEQGDAKAQNNLGSSTPTARVCPKTMPKREMVRMAAEQGHATKQPDKYANGEGVERPYRGQVVPHGRRAGARPAASQLGFDGAPEDDAEAVKWYRMAAEQWRNTTWAKYPAVGVLPKDHFPHGRRARVCRGAIQPGRYVRPRQGCAERRCRSGEVVPHGRACQGAIQPLMYARGRGVPKDGAEG